VPRGATPTVTGAVEGDLDEAVLRRIVEHAGLSLRIVYGRKGKSFLLQSLTGYNNAARFAPWVCLVDLDRDCDCAPPCMQSWLPNPAAHMCFRIAVRAVEAWLLADRERIAQLLRITIAHVPQNPDTLNDPKQQLINLARGSRLHTIRSDLAPREGSGRCVGPLYTARMIQFVNDETGGWRPAHALHVSQSLARCIKRLQERAR
jgi:hypothetical protein